MILYSRELKADATRPGNNYLSNTDDPNGGTEGQSLSLAFRAAAKICLS
jgi:hypothetical protein